MYWINRKIIKSVLRNPFDSTELIKGPKANQIFKEIYDEYLKEFENDWTRGSMPLNYFLKVYCEKTGADKKGLEEEFKNYFEKNSVTYEI